MKNKKEQKNVTIHGVTQTRDNAVQNNMKLVHTVCHKYKNRASLLGFDYDDLVSIGTIGLIKAVDRFDDSFGYRFSTYAVPWITGLILRELRDANLGPRYSRRIKEVGWEIQKRELIDLNSEEISIILNQEENTVVEALMFLKNRNPYHLDKEFETGDGKGTLADIIGKEDDNTAIYVEEFLNTLSAQEKEILQRRMAGQSQTIIAEAVGIYQPKVSRILKKIGKRYKENQSRSKVN